MGETKTTKHSRRDETVVKRLAKRRQSTLEREEPRFALSFLGKKDNKKEAQIGEDSNTHKKGAFHRAPHNLKGPLSLSLSLFAHDDDKRRRRRRRRREERRVVDDIMAFGGGFGGSSNVPQSPFGQAPASPFGGGFSNQGGSGGPFSQPSSGGRGGGFGQPQQTTPGGGFGQQQQQQASPGTSAFLGVVLIRDFDSFFFFLSRIFLLLLLLLLLLLRVSRAMRFSRFQQFASSVERSLTNGYLFYQRFFVRRHNSCKRVSILEQRKL